MNTQMRHAAGAQLTPEQRREVLKTLTDVYRLKNAPLEFKGNTPAGNERHGYAHSPDLFERSDITGAMLRYYVTMPDGRRAHPSELFPDFTQSDIDAAMAQQDAQAKIQAQRDKDMRDRLMRRSAPTYREAVVAYRQANPSTGKPDPFVCLTNGSICVVVAQSSQVTAQRVLGDEWSLKFPATGNALPERPTTWVIREIDGKKPIMETAQKSVLEKINRDRYEAVPFQQHIGELNAAIKAGETPAWALSEQAAQETGPDLPAPTC